MSKSQETVYFDKEVQRLNIPFSILPTAGSWPNILPSVFGNTVNNAERATAITP